MNTKQRLLLNVVVATVIGLYIYGGNIQAPVIAEQEEIPEAVIEAPKTVIEIIGEIAPQFEQDPKLIEKITWCESHHEVKSHDGGRGTNVTGIHDKTFDGWLPLYEKERGETLDKASTYDQIKMMSWAFSKGDSYRNQWTTYVAYMNGGTYSFYSRLLEAHFTVKCK